MKAQQVYTFITEQNVNGEKDRNNMKTVQHDFPQKKGKKEKRKKAITAATGSTLVLCKSFLVGIAMPRPLPPTASPSPPAPCRPQSSSRPPPQPPTPQTQQKATT
eukprot:comp12642_c0_seq1/m.7697 comp12642_c0_seq1/g.7697  ORF comp12642_c0_seq1/g.7697 comp12642_c0_seq1/m.7697 type:complete len:105 (+) comp12642_c0_seq1:775-1089(+)